MYYSCQMQKQIQFYHKPWQIAYPKPYEQIYSDKYACQICFSVSNCDPKSRIVPNSVTKCLLKHAFTNTPKSQGDDHVFQRVVDPQHVFGPWKYRNQYKSLNNTKLNGGVMIHVKHKYTNCISLKLHNKIITNITMYSILKRSNRSNTSNYIWDHIEKWKF